MSGPHATISAWTRDEHAGHYTADLHDWNLMVVWKPKDHWERGLFWWEAEREGDRKHLSPNGYPEIELAMAAAEKFAATEAKARETKATEPAETTEPAEDDA